MIRGIITRIAGVLLLAALSLPARAAINYQDMWWNPNESGWGVNIAQQDNTMFATWFIYGANRQPLWLVMSNAQRSGAAGNTFTGELYQTVGTPFSVTPFVPLPASDVTQVGTATFIFSNARAGTLTYTVNNVQVVKPITRQPLANINLTGTYYGGLFRTATCASSGVSNSIYSITHTPAIGSASITEVGGNNCRFTGTLTQFGSIFEGSGSYTCQGETGTWTGAEGTGGESTFAMKLTLQTGAGTCTATLGGFKSP
ncbi:MAG: hypothetical protein IPP88_24060 [Betaproteobacteria bacterium]|nr:hypothetical protein [Betaproteobacteria bacterium]